MNATFAFCAIVITGWVSPGIEEPIAPSPETSPAQPSSRQPSYALSTGARPTRAVNEGAMSPPRMPVPPTDPRAFFRGDLPVPPTMNYSSTFPSAGMAGAAPRHAAGGQADNSGRRLPSQKPFDNYKPAPAESPYLLLNCPTDNGTISPYMTYVRPAQEQQRANLEFGGGTSSQAALPSYGP